MCIKIINDSRQGDTEKNWEVLRGNPAVLLLSVESQKKQKVLQECQKSFININCNELNDLLMAELSIEGYEAANGHYEVTKPYSIQHSWMAETAEKKERGAHRDE